MAITLVLDDKSLEFKKLPQTLEELRAELNQIAKKQLATSLNLFDISTDQNYPVRDELDYLDFHSACTSSQELEDKVLHVVENLYEVANASRTSIDDDTSTLTSLSQEENTSRSRKEDEISKSVGCIEAILALAIINPDFSAKSLETIDSQKASGKEPRKKKIKGGLAAKVSLPKAPKGKQGGMRMFKQP